MEDFPAVSSTPRNRFRGCSRPWRSAKSTEEDFPARLRTAISTIEARNARFLSAAPGTGSVPRKAALAHLHLFTVPAPLLRPPAVKTSLPSPIFKCANLLGSLPWQRWRGRNSARSLPSKIQQSAQSPGRPASNSRQSTNSDGRLPTYPPQRADLPCPLPSCFFHRANLTGRLPWLIPGRANSQRKLRPAPTNGSKAPRFEKVRHAWHRPPGAPSTWQHRLNGASAGRLPHFLQDRLEYRR